MKVLSPLMSDDLYIGTYLLGMIWFWANGSSWTFFVGMSNDDMSTNCIRVGDGSRNSSSLFSPKRIRVSDKKISVNKSDNLSNVIGSSVLIISSFCISFSVVSSIISISSEEMTVGDVCLGYETFDVSATRGSEECLSLFTNKSSKMAITAAVDKRVLKMVTGLLTLFRDSFLG